MVAKSLGRRSRWQRMSQVAAVTPTSVPRPVADATGRQVLRAADALEAATQLRLSGYAPRFDLFALLAAVTGPTVVASRADCACVARVRGGVARG